MNTTTLTPTPRTDAEALNGACEVYQRWAVDLVPASLALTYVEPRQYVEAYIRHLLGQLEGCKGVLKEWQAAERAQRERAEALLAAGNTLADQFARHDGCSRWCVADMAAMRDWQRTAGRQEEAA